MKNSFELESKCSKSTAEKFHQYLEKATRPKKVKSTSNKD